MDSVLSTLHSLHFDLTTFICQTVLFLIFHFGMRGILYDKLIQVRNERDGQIEGKLSEAEKMAAGAMQMKTDYEQKLRALRGELQVQLQDASAAAEKEAAAKVSAAREEASKVLEAARVSVESDRVKAEAEMGPRVDTLAKEIANRILENSLSPSAQARAKSLLGS